MLLLTVCFGILGFGSAFAQNESAKARFMNDMTKAIYVKWPTSITTLDVAILKNRELFNELQLANSEGLGLYAKNLNIQLYNDPKEISKANIIYVHHTDFPNIDRLIAAVQVVLWKFQREITYFRSVYGEVEQLVNRKLYDVLLHRNDLDHLRACAETASTAILIGPCF